MTCDPSTLTRLAACFSCIPKEARPSVELYLLCQILSGGGGGSILSGAGAPSASPSNTANVSLYLNLSTGVLYYWNPVTQAWNLVTTGAGAQQIYQSAGNPNGVVTVTTALPCICLDTVGNITWAKTDGLLTNTGWY